MYKKFCEDELTKHSEKIKSMLNEMVDNISNEYLPYVASDTVVNVEHRASEIVKKLLEGNFTINPISFGVGEDSGLFLVVDSNGKETYISLNLAHWDRFRRELIKLMPECPKDAEIRELKEEIERLRSSLSEKYHW